MNHIRRNSKRRNKNWIRSFHSAERVEWVNARGCLIHNAECEGPIQNAHTQGGGMGRRADASTVVGLCNGHHCELHHHGVVTFQNKYRVMLVVAAELVEAAWQLHALKGVSPLWKRGAA